MKQQNGAATTAAQIRKMDFFKRFRQIVTKRLRHAVGYENVTSTMVTNVLKALIPNNLVVPTKFLEEAIQFAKEHWPVEDNLFRDWEEQKRACFIIGAILGYCQPDFSGVEFRLDPHNERPAFKKGMSFGLKEWRKKFKGSF